MDNWNYGLWMILIFNFEREIKMNVKTESETKMSTSGNKISLNIKDPINRKMTIAKLSCNVNDIADIRTAITLANDLISLGYKVDNEELLNSLNIQLFNI